VHGQASSQESYKSGAEVASARLDAVCLTFNLSGHGKDIGDSEEYLVIEHLDDVIAAFDFLASHPAVDRTRIGVCGASYGAYLAALLTALSQFLSFNPEGPFARRRP
jgi:cephalosporin-C deacetylase-like acetyl esterase